MSPILINYIKIRRSLENLNTCKQARVNGILWWYFITHKVFMKKFFGEKGPEVKIRGFPHKYNLRLTDKRKYRFEWGSFWLTLWNITSKSSSFPCKSPQIVIWLEIEVVATFMFGNLFNIWAASFKICATCFGCNRCWNKAAYKISMHRNIHIALWRNSALWDINGKSEVRFQVEKIWNCLLSIFSHYHSLKNCQSGQGWSEM